MTDAPKHVTCVLPTTAARRLFIPWACRWFLRQTVSDADLLVVGDGEEPVVDVVPRHERIRTVHLPGGPWRLGAKYNACVERAKGPYVALWADDDWHGPLKLASLLFALERKPGSLIAGARAMIFHRIASNRTHVYEKPGDPRDAYFLGGSILFHKDYWRKVRQFDESATRAADASFTNSLSRAEYAELAAQLTPFASLATYVATIHPGNTGRGDADPSGPGWRPYRSSLQTLMGPDYEVWRPGGAIFDGLFAKSSTR